MHLTSPYLLSSTYLVLKASATCFFPNGSADASGQQAPCKTGGHSMCCLTANIATSDADTCRGDGLCIPSNNGQLFRDTCTDQTWQDPACVPLCMTGTDDFGNRSANVYMPLTNCADGSFCCGQWDGEQGPQCCNKKGGTFLVNGKLQTTKPSATSATGQSTAAATTTSGTSSPTSDSSSNTTSSSSSSSNNTGAIVGGVVGGIAGVVILGLAFWYFMIRRKYANGHHLRNQPQSYEPYQTQPGGELKSWYNNGAGAPAGTRVGELDAAANSGELDGTANQRAPELDGYHVK